MHLPFSIDNQTIKAADVFSRLLCAGRGCPVDIATAYFSISGYAVLQNSLANLGALRLLLGSEPSSGSDIGLRPDSRLAAELAGMPFDEQTLRLVENLIAFLQSEQVQVRFYQDGFLHAKAYLFHQDRVGPGNYDDRLRPFAAVVGSSNFTGPGLTTNKELNLVHRVFTEEDEPVDRGAAARADYLRPNAPPETLLDPSGVEVPAQARRSIKSEVGTRAVMELEQWFTRNWQASADFKQQLIDLLNKSKFGQYEYSPYQIYLKALYEYLRDQLDAGDELLFGRSAVNLAEFQEDSVRRARRILQRYDGVLIADSVGLGKTWIGKKLLEDYAYHQRMKALVICPASLRPMWQRELAESTISAQVLGMEGLGRETFDPAPYADADVILIDEAHNFRSDKANRYLALDDLIHRKGGMGREGMRKKIILLSATPINNDLYDLLNQMRLFTQNEPDYFREAGIGDINAYFRAARRAARQEGKAAGELLFNLLDEFVVRNTRPYIRVAYPNATINGEPVRFPDRTLNTIEYSLESVYSGLYQHVVEAINSLALAPYALESYRREELKTEETRFEVGREEGLVGIFKTRFLKRLESSVEAFRVSVNRALALEQVYRDFLNKGTVISSRDFWKMLRLAELDAEDDLDGDQLAGELESVEAVREYLQTLAPVTLKDYYVDQIRAAVDADIRILSDLHNRVQPLVARDAKLAKLKVLLAGELKGKKVLIFTSYKDTARYLDQELAKGKSPWLAEAGNPHIRRIDSGNHPDERQGIVAAFAPRAMANSAGFKPTDREIDVLISTDVLSEGQNLQDCGVMINYDLTWNPIRLVQRSGRIDRLRSTHEQIAIWNMFPEQGLEKLLHLIERLTNRIEQIDDLGMLDASVLGEVVHPRTFNTIRRVKDGDVTVLDEEEARAELAGPEMLLKSLREMLKREGTVDAAKLPDGIHSGLRRQKAYGIFFYFRAPRSEGIGLRHFWRYIDAKTHAVVDNRFQIAQLIECRADEPRYIGDQDVFVLQEKVIESILGEEQKVAAKARLASSPDPVQVALAETIKSAIRRGSVDRAKARAALQFLDQPAGKGLLARLKLIHKAYQDSPQAAKLVDDVAAMIVEYGKTGAGDDTDPGLSRESLSLICFEYISS